MATLTKVEAIEVAKQMLSKHKERLVDAERLFKETFSEHYLATLPVGVLQLFHQGSNYLNKSCQLTINGDGWNFERVTLDRDVPRLNSNTAISFDSQVSLKLRKMCDDVGDQRKQYVETKDAIIVALNTLRTYKKIGESLPEAIPFLPNKTTTALALNLDELRNKIK